MTEPTPAPPAPAFPLGKYLIRLAPVALLWAALIAWLGWLLFTRANWTKESDDADVREWLAETRVFRKSLPELVRDYAAQLDQPGDADTAALRHDEVAAHIEALVEPTRVYSGKLPLFPEVYSLTVECRGMNPPPGRAAHPTWQSPVLRPGGDARVRTLEIYPNGPENPQVVIRCQFRAHTYSTFQRDRQQARTAQLIGLGVLVPASVVGLVFVVRFLRRERERELHKWQTAVDAEHRERELLEAKVKRQDAEHATEELGRKLLVQELDAARLETRAVEAERTTFEMKSQLYASIGIMAGSYAHNIKNLLVRPNDLLSRCLEADGMTREQQGMLQEVKGTLGTVTERLQQILRTVRRDPSNAEKTRLDLAALVRESVETWAVMGREKWKLSISADAPGRLPIDGDLSHLQQAIENLLFNARDATFEMRNHLREEARRVADPTARKQQLIDAAAWKGEVTLSARAEGDTAVLEVSDNGIGMTESVRRNCLTTHFSTKRDNALYEGYSAGMGLGLSFVAVVLEHHGAALEIDSAPLRGSVFRVRIPLAEPR